MLNTLTKPRFQTFVKIFQGPTDRPTDTPSPRSSSSELNKIMSYNLQFIYTFPFVNLF